MKQCARQTMNYSLETMHFTLRHSTMDIVYSRLFGIHCIVLEVNKQVDCKVSCKLCHIVFDCHLW